MQNHLAEMQDNGRSALEVLTREARMAGYLGCVNETSVATPPFTSIKGYTTLTAYKADVPAGITSSDFTVVSASNILVIRHGSYKSIPLTGANTTTSVSAGPDTYTWNGTTPTLLVSDCVAASQFTPTAITGSSTATSITTASVAGSYNSSARVRPVETSTFFLATPTGRAQPSLYQRYSDGYVNVDLRIADNVSQWDLTYAYGANDSKLDASEATASTVTDWSQVKGMRVDLLLISSKPQLSAPATYFYNFSSNTPSDNYLRKEMSSTLAIRNRITGIPS
jgi:type IV pilus assembly protein PilW